jgi:hypothetical protein
MAAVWLNYHTYVHKGKPVSLRNHHMKKGILKPGVKNRVKGKVSQDFLLQVFFMNHLSQAPKNNIRVMLNLLENSRRY